MLLQSLQSAGVPASVAELERRRPSWSLEDIGAPTQGAAGAGMAHARAYAHC